jgi:phosphoglycerol transferase MdoB-like AlkP superfamily enzyme
MPRLIPLSRINRLLLLFGVVLLVLMSLMRYMVAFTFAPGNADNSTLGYAYLLGLRYDLRIVCWILLAMLIAGSIPATSPFYSKTTRRIWMIVTGLLLTILVFVYVVDFAHFSYLQQRLNASVLNYLEDAGISLNMVWESYPVFKLLAMIVLVAAITTGLFVVILRKTSKNDEPNTPRARWINLILMGLLLGIGIFGRIGQYPLRWSDAFALGNDFSANLALNPFESFLNTLRFRKHTYDKEKLSELMPVLRRAYDLPGSSDTFEFTRHVSGTDKGSSKPNIVLVICESFSAYKSSMWGNPLNTTPYFDSLSRQGLFFENCFSPAYGTARGVWATITGIPDVEMPTTASRNPAAVNQPTIINDFREYAKLYFLGGSTSWANIRGLLQNNIDGLRIYEEDDFKSPRIDVWGISDKNLFLEANDILSTQTQPFFAVIQTADNHRPYTIPEEDLQEFQKKSVPKDSLERYGFESVEEYNAFRYTDYSFQKFMHAAASKSYFANTIFIFVGDHGIPGDAHEMFPEVWTTQRLTSHHVPLLYYAARYIPAQRSKKFASQVDVLPTLAGLCNISYTNRTLGRDLLKDSSGLDFAFTFDVDNRQLGLITDKYYYRRQIGTSNETLYPIVAQAVISDSSKMLSRQLCDGIFEAAKWMLVRGKQPVR